MLSHPPNIITPIEPNQAAIENLRAYGPHPAHADALRTFGQFIGVWDMDIKLFDKTGNTIYHQLGVWMFSWILDGRAIQDVLIGPPRPTQPSTERAMGTTIRYYNEAKKRWQITWMTPSGRTCIHLEGGQRGDGIFLEGTDVDGSPLRWMFSEITPDSFHWRGYISDDSGKSWRMEQEMFARRRATDSVTPVKHTALWRRLDLAGLESARLEQTPNGWELSGAASFQYRDAPCLLDYNVRCDASWNSRSVSVYGVVGNEVVHHELRVSPTGRWVHNDVEVPELDGCTDVDLNFTPSTNTLPIRRLSLPIGGSAEIRAAWLRFPDFALRPLVQTYTRKTADRYGYRAGTFESEISFDSAGFVRDYPPAWRAIAATPRSKGQRKEAVPR
jgi:hypothetical protein